jgi:O-antigen ligase
MVLVILTEDDPVEAARNVFVRCSYVLVPLSLLFIRYIPELGRRYDYGGNMMFVGVCPSKNTLGSLVLVSSLFLFWDLFNELHKEAGSRDRGGVCARIFMLVLLVWVLRLSDCATALSCTLVGMGIFFGLRLPFIKRNLRFMEVYLALGVLVFVVLNSIFNLRETLFHSLGRNATLTGRTDLWDLLLRHQPNVLIGAGFNSFWSGDSLREIWKTIPGVVQAHNGYLDTYLNGGILGVAFLLAWLWSTARRIKKSAMEGADFASMRMAFLCIALIYDWTEAAFNKTGLLWLVLLLVAMNPPGGCRVPAKIPSSGLDEEEAAVELAGGVPYRSGSGV